ncbi:elongin-C [Antrostomus carolinensis]|uniref:elongin-C n=1 Tax=Antrostomus carolinensis TaxID=279965 RepID=UPI0010A9870C|nr:elongin-C [Antrostomus carolinensis]
MFTRSYGKEFFSLMMKVSLKFAENETNEVNFREIPSHVLSKVCMYFTYKVRYTNSSTEIPEFPIAPEIALELLMAANFLDC